MRSQRRAQGSADPNAQGGQVVKTTESKKADGEPNRLSSRFTVEENGVKTQKTAPTARFSASGGSFYDGTGKNLLEGKIKGVWAAQVDLLEKMSRLLGLNIEIYESQDGIITDRRGNNE